LSKLQLMFDLAILWVLPSGNLTLLLKIPFSMGKSTINGHFQ
jgi:hypothetical protein